MDRPAPARLLDLSRLVSRLDRPAPTGVDRVERAYLQRLLADPAPCFGLVRTSAGFLLLDRSGMAALAQCPAPLDRPDLLGRLLLRRDPGRGAAEASARRLAMDRSIPLALPLMLRRHLPAGTSYLNVGHANLSDRVMRAVRAVPKARVAVLVHDVIPLDHPEFSRPGIPGRFARKLAAVATHADLVIHTTGDSRQRTERRLQEAGRVPQALVAPLGVPDPVPDPVHLPATLPLDRPWYVALGTIEPRKNHALLLDVWDLLRARLPQNRRPRLFVLGARGWARADLLARLDRAVAGGDVCWAAGLPDGAVAALLAGARGLLFPTLAEGFGLPPVEAAALGVPVICSDLQVLRETLADYPVYLDPSDRYSWARTIETQLGAGAALKAEPMARRAGPGWDSHFNLVLSRV